MPVTLRHRDGFDVFLRSKPDNMAPLTNISIKSGEEINMVDWELNKGEDDFVHVSCDRGDGWIRLRHLEIEASAQIYTQLTDSEWYLVHWQIHIDQCSIRVSRGSYDRKELEKAFAEMNLAKAFRKRSSTIDEMVEMGYTYVSLELGHPFNAKGMEVAYRGAHITIAYAATMHDDYMWELYYALEYIVEAWRRISPELRPSRLIRFREFKFKKPEELGYDCWTKEAIVFKPLHKILEMVEAGLIECSGEVDPEDFPGYLERIWLRDRSRLESAKSRAQRLHKFDTDKNILHMMRCESGLGGESYDLEDLLEYLADCVFYFHKCHIRNRAGKLVPPFVAGPSSWHCSRISEWQRTIRNH